MCGRFENKVNENVLVQLLKELKLNLIIDDSMNNKNKEDIRPTQKIFTLRWINEQYNLSLVNWGIKFSDESPLIFNSRIETIKEKKFWFNLFNKNRCIVPMTGFYEWKKEGAKKIKYKIFLPGPNIFYVPALYYSDKGENIFVSLITTTPNKFIKLIHHRMPVIFNLGKAIHFLRNEASANLDLCVPYEDSNRMDMELA